MNPSDTVAEWLTALLHGDVDTAWTLTDPTQRLVFAQAWILARDRPIISDEHRDGFAQAICDRSYDAVWPRFSSWLTSTLGAVFAPYRAGWRLVGEPVPVAVDLEVVHLHPIGGTAGAVTVRHTLDGCRVAGIGPYLPVPGWPPTTEALV